MDRDSNRSATIHRLAGKPGVRGKIDAYCISCVYQVKAALDNKKTSPEGLASNDITTDNGVGAPNTSTGGTSRCVPLF